MRLGTLALLLTLTAFPTTLWADVTLVDEDFESYASDAALFTVWGGGTGNAQLVDQDYETFLTGDDLEPQAVGMVAFPDGGQGVEHTGGAVLEYLPVLGGTDPLVPTDSQNLVLKGDVFSLKEVGNLRLAIGLRHSSPAENIIEMGHWNDEASSLSYRAILFPLTEENPDANPDWQAFELPAAFDTNSNGVSLDEVSPGWHTFTAIISPHSITFELDLFRDGLDADGQPGVDVSTVAAVSVGPNGFDALRFGGPSNVSSAGNGEYGGTFFDNISLTLVDVDTGLAGDFNSDDIVDAADYAVWRNGFGTEYDINDYNNWRSNYGMSAGAVASLIAAPEPSSLLSVVALFGLAGVARRPRC